MKVRVAQAVPSARPQIVVPGMMPWDFSSSISMSRSLGRPWPSRMRSRIFRIHAAFPARRALSAAFVGVKPHAVAQSLDHVGVFVHHDHAGSPEAQTSAAETDIVEIEFDIQLIGPKHAHGDSAADRALVLSALHSAGKFVDGVIERDPKFVFVNAGLIHMAGHAEKFRPRPRWRTHRLKPGRTALDDRRDTAERLDVINNRRPAKRCRDRRERRFIPRPAALALNDSSNPVSSPRYTPRRRM